jgi:nitroreductase
MNCEPFRCLVRRPGEYAGSAVVTADRTLFDQFLFESARPDGPVVHGLRHCTAALREGNADALMIGAEALGDRSVWVGGTRRDQVAEVSAALRALGMPPNRQRADEALPMAALAVGAEVLVAPDDLPLVDGLGLLLSHP